MTRISPEEAKREVSERIAQQEHEDLQRRAVAVSRASTAGRGLMATKPHRERRVAMYLDMMNTMRGKKRTMKNQNAYWAALKAKVK